MVLHRNDTVNAVSASVMGKPIYMTDTTTHAYVTEDRTSQHVGDVGRQAAVKMLTAESVTAAFVKKNTLTEPLT